MHESSRQRRGLTCHREASDERFRAMVESCPQVVSLLDREGRVIYIKRRPRAACSAAGRGLPGPQLRRLPRLGGPGGVRPPAGGLPGRATPRGRTATAAEHSTAGTPAATAAPSRSALVEPAGRPGAGRGGVLRPGRQRPGADAVRLCRETGSPRWGCWRPAVVARDQQPAGGHRDQPRAGRQPAGRPPGGAASRVRSTRPSWPRTSASAREATERVRQIVRDLAVFSAREDDEPDRRRRRGRCSTASARMAGQRDPAAGPAGAGLRHRCRAVLRERVAAGAGVPQPAASRRRAALTPAGTPDNVIRLSTRRRRGRAGCWSRSPAAAPGVPPEMRERMFTPFASRTRPAAAARSPGWGCAVCQRIVHELGGEIDVEANPAGGSLFRVSLPPQRPRAPPARRGLSRRGPAGPAAGAGAGGRRRAHHQQRHRPHAGARARRGHRDPGGRGPGPAARGRAFRRDLLRPDDAADDGHGPAPRAVGRAARAGRPHDLPDRRGLHRRRPPLPRGGAEPPGREALRHAPAARHRQRPRSLIGAGRTARARISGAGKTQSVATPSSRRRPYSRRT